MSYAAVAAHNAPLPSEQPHPDRSLLNTVPSTASNVANDTAKVGVVSSDFKQNPATTTSTAQVIVDVDEEEMPHSDPSDRRKRGKAHKHLQEAEAEGLYLWNAVKMALFRPGVAGGLLGIVNVGLLAGVSRQFYLEPHLRRDGRFIASVLAGAATLLSFEGYAAEKYVQTAQGKAEAAKAKQEGSIIYRNLREHILRPGVLGGLVGILNVGILGTVGYFGYTNWNRPHWDRRTVSAVSAGLLTLWGGEGYLVERYRTERLN